MEQSETMVMEQRELFPCSPNPSVSEMEVADILLQLPDMIYQFESPLPVPLSLGWGCKSKRSALAVQNDHASTLQRLRHLGLPPCWSKLLLRCRFTPRSLAKSPVPLLSNAIKVETSSPDTPLSFEPNESDDKPQQLRRRVLGKRKREEWSKIIDELTEEKESVQFELQKVERHYVDLNDFNLELKARKEKLMGLGHKQEEESRLEIEPSLNNAVVPLCQPAQQPRVLSPPVAAAANQEQYHQQHHEQIHPPPSVMHYQHQLQLIMDQTAQTQRREICENLRYGYPSNSSTQVPSSISLASSGGSASGLRRMVNCNNNVVGPRGLNLCLKDTIVMSSSQPYDLTLVNNTRFVAAQNRQKRLEYCRLKRPRFATTLR
ncbi:PREDICTED: uncharacterized protein LOC103321384 isoform X1 [Prunus mume]|uniref:Uncharacterized protein LOC103321384 isoform X1 n=1 Tax=Prunus mume TaxID=102107 RepID=A0ABM1LJI7_PRUMU|nr:PREDICTED: uncharacterized protein LOC103321384 isoform X1 [Prunus mume]